MLLTETIKREALALGFDAVGVSRVESRQAPAEALFPPRPRDFLTPSLIQPSRGMAPARLPRHDGLDDS